MSLSVESYWPLLLAPAVLFLFWVRRRTETSLSGRHLAALTLVRSAVALMLLVTLMRPHLNRPSKDISAVFAVDVSRSIAPEFLSAAIQWCADAVAEGRPAHARFIGFAGDAAIVERADELGRLAVYDGGWGAWVQDPTNPVAVGVPSSCERTPRQRRALR